MENGKKIRIISKSINFTVCLILLLCVTVGAVAYFTDIDELHNEFEIGYVETPPQEEYNPPDELIPGEKFLKKVWIANTGKVDCYSRVLVKFTDHDMERFCIVDYNTTDYVYNEDDGYYYLINKLEVGETSPNLFTTVTLKEKYDIDGDGVEESLTEEDMKEFDIMVYVESFQSMYNNAESGESREFTDYKEAWTYYDRHRK